MERLASPAASGEARPFTGGSRGPSEDGGEDSTFAIAPHPRKMSREVARSMEGVAPLRQAAVDLDLAESRQWLHRPGGQAAAAFRADPHSKFRSRREPPPHDRPRVTATSKAKSDFALLVAAAEDEQALRAARGREPRREVPRPHSTDPSVGLRMHAQQSLQPPKAPRAGSEILAREHENPSPSPAGAMLDARAPGSGRHIACVSPSHRLPDSSPAANGSTAQHGARLQRSAPAGGPSLRAPQRCPGTGDGGGRARNTLSASLLGGGRQSEARAPSASRRDLPPGDVRYVGAMFVLEGEGGGAKEGRWHEREVALHSDGELSYELREAAGRRARGGAAQTLVVLCNATRCSAALWDTALPFQFGLCLLPDGPAQTFSGLPPLQGAPAGVAHREVKVAFFSAEKRQAFLRALSSELMTSRSDLAGGPAPGMSRASGAAGARTPGRGRRGSQGQAGARRREGGALGEDEINHAKVEEWIARTAAPAAINALHDMESVRRRRQLAVEPSSDGALGREELDAFLHLVSRQERREAAAARGSAAAPARRSRADPKSQGQRRAPAAARRPPEPRRPGVAELFSPESLIAARSALLPSLGAFFSIASPTTSDDPQREGAVSDDGFAGLGAPGAAGEGPAAGAALEAQEREREHPASSSAGGNAQGASRPGTGIAPAESAHSSFCVEAGQGATSSAASSVAAVVPQSAGDRDVGTESSGQGVIADEAKIDAEPEVSVQDTEGLEAGENSPVKAGSGSDSDSDSDSEAQAPEAPFIGVARSPAESLGSAGGRKAAGGEAPAAPAALPGSEGQDSGRRVDPSPAMLHRKSLHNLFERQATKKDLSQVMAEAAASAAASAEPWDESGSASSPGSPAVRPRGRVDWREPTAEEIEAAGLTPEERLDRELADLKIYRMRLARNSTAKRLVERAHGSQSPTRSGGVSPGGRSPYAGKGGGGSPGAGAEGEEGEAAQSAEEQAFRELGAWSVQGGLGAYMEEPRRQARSVSMRGGFSPVPGSPARGSAGRASPVPGAAGLSEGEEEEEEWSPAMERAGAPDGAGRAEQLAREAAEEKRARQVVEGMRAEWIAEAVRAVGGEVWSRMSWVAQLGVLEMLMSDARDVREAMAQQGKWKEQQAALGASVALTVTDYREMLPELLYKAVRAEKGVQVVGLLNGCEEGPVRDAAADMAFRLAQEHGKSAVRGHLEARGFAHSGPAGAAPEAAGPDDQLPRRAAEPEHPSRRTRLNSKAERRLTERLARPRAPLSPQPARSTGGSPGRRENGSKVSFLGAAEATGPLQDQPPAALARPRDVLRLDSRGDVLEGAADGAASQPWAGRPGSEAALAAAVSTSEDSVGAASAASDDSDAEAPPRPSTTERARQISEAALYAPEQGAARPRAGPEEAEASPLARDGRRKGSVSQEALEDFMEEQPVRALFAKLQGQHLIEKLDLWKRLVAERRELRLQIPRQLLTCCDACGIAPVGINNLRRFVMRERAGSTLVLSGQGITAASVRPLLDALCGTGAAAQHGSGHDIGELRETLDDAALAELVLEGNSLEAEGLGALAEALLARRWGVQSLRLDANTLREPAVLPLAALLRVTDKGRALTRLELGNNPLGDRGVAVLAQLLHSNAHLRHLGLSATGAQNHAGRELGAMLASNGYLLTLDLSFNMIRADAAKDLAAGLCDNVALESLNVAWNGLGDASCVAVLARAVQQGGLVSLDLAHNRVLRGGAILLAGSLAKTEGRLRRLVMDGNPITQAGARVLFKAAKEAARGQEFAIAISAEHCGLGIVDNAAFNPPPPPLLVLSGHAASLTPY